MQKYPTFLLLLVPMLLLIAIVGFNRDVVSYTSSQTGWVKPDNGLRVELQPERTQIPVGTPINVTLGVIAEPGISTIAPTPASAFLHSATMVKAGIYLLARLNPALGYTEIWFWLLSIVGLTTMVTGAYLGTKQKDLKALLAYSTIAQLGILIMLIGQDTEIAFNIRYWG